ncbi:putative glycosidase crf1 [Lachnellula suecica]|uniref:chitinase n=1 Tax=Lachnellula suecica TaxID=602035 RepID=A0A8T9C1J9_9HELO|nr:putative glycosidase crf1 [Lachnellula suecica]
MRSQILSLAATAATLSQLVSGQTSTTCNPTTNSTCPSDTALGKTITVDFTQGESSEFTAESGTTITYGTSGAEFILTSTGEAQTITTENYIFFGKVEIAMKAAPGTGVVSSCVMESDDLDEIDLEWLGGNTTTVETNYFGKGNTTTYDRAIYEAVDDPQDNFHIYTIDWTSAYVKWYVDGTLVRTLLYADALDGKNFPQTPMKIKMGIWDGGAADESTGTVEWAGGYTDLTNAPFTMYVANITIQDYTTNGTEYTYGDESGDWQSIIISDSTSNDTTSDSTGTTTATSNSTSGSGSSATSSANSSTSSVATFTSGVAALSSSYFLGVVGLGLAVFYL